MSSAFLTRSDTNQPSNKQPRMQAILPQNALRRDCNDKYFELNEGHYLEVVVEV